MNAQIVHDTLSALTNSLSSEEGYNVRRRTNVQQLTCYFYGLFFSFVLIELKPFVLKGKVVGENF